MRGKRGADEPVTQEAAGQGCGLAAQVQKREAITTLMHPGIDQAVPEHLFYSVNDTEAHSSVQLVLVTRQESKVSHVLGFE